MKVHLVPGEEILIVDTYIIYMYVHMYIYNAFKSHEKKGRIMTKNLKKAY